jgi:uncharacterized membrane protein YhaH (DUF805 family)
MNGFWEWLEATVANFKAYVRSLDFWGLVRLVLIIGALTFLAEMTLKGVGAVVKVATIISVTLLVLLIGLPWLHSIFGWP